MAEALAPGRALGLAFRPPDGGIYQWCRVPSGVDRPRLLASAAERGVAFFPGGSCFVGEPSGEFIRLNFSYPSIGHIRDGIPRLLDELAEATPAAIPPAAAVQPAEAPAPPNGTWPARNTC